MLLGMSTKAPETTYKHRNLIDDVLDGMLAVVAILYLVAGDQWGFHLDDKTLALIATAGGTLRVAVRKISMRIWGDKLALVGAAEDAQEAPVASNSEESEH
jgi:Flp pilus assembly CpaE family ATPase